VVDCYVRHQLDNVAHAYWLAASAWIQTLGAELQSLVY